MNAILKKLVSVLLIRGVIQKAHTTTDFIVCAPRLVKILFLIAREIKTKRVFTGREIISLQTIDL